MTVYLNDRVVCVSKAEYGPGTNDGVRQWTTIAKMTDCEKPFPVKKGDRIGLETGYDEVAHLL